VSDPAAPDAPQWPLTPPTIVRSEGVERRANSRALKYWKELAGPRKFPARGQLAAETAGDLWDNLFVVEVATAAKDYRFVHAGAVLIQALGSDPTGQTVQETIPGGMGTRTLFFHQAAVGLKGPVDDAGSWTRADGTQILYRSILLPLSDDQQTVNYLLGVFSFRPVPANS
jgi:hypothetical protein